MLKFSKEELRYILIIFSILVVLTLLNLRISVRKARDAQRRADINSIFNALSKYQNEFGFFPPSSSDGKIVACRDEAYTPPSEDLTDSEKKQYFIDTLVACDWGVDQLKDVSDPSHEAYMNRIPQDPNSSKGFSYRYDSNMRRFQLFAYLEGGLDEEGFKESVVKRQLSCGGNICNFGKAFADEDASKSIEEIEIEIAKKENN